MSEENSKKQPVKKIKVGNVFIAIWENVVGGEEETQKTFTNITIKKSYMDKENNWKDSNIYDSNDILKLIAGLQEAYRFMAIKEV